MSHSPVASKIDPRIAGGVSFFGFLLMAVGAVLLTSASGDLFAGMQTSDSEVLGDHLTDVAGSQGQLATALALWIAGVPTIAIGIGLLSRLGSDVTAASVARTAATIAAGGAIVFYSIMMGIVVGLAPAHEAGDDVIAAARALGVAADTADWAATELVLGISPVAAVLAGRRDWAPRWLVYFSLFTGAVGLFSVVMVAARQYDVAFVLIPVGMIHLAVASVVAFLSNR